MSAGCRCRGTSAVTGPCAGPGSCGCCQGVQALTPAAIINRPGLGQIAYRAGTHGSFLATMLARLSSAGEPALHALTVRGEDDPSIAFLDCWATIADVLTFYQERIANEGYLRTATERRSVLELAHLVGYQLRPGLGASAYLAYTLQANPAKVTTATIPKGSQAVSVPGPGQQPQTFETSDDLSAQQTWNTLPVRQTKPATITADLLTRGVQVPVQGAALSIDPGDRMVFSGPAAGAAPVQMSVQAVSADAPAQVTTLTLLPDPAPPTAPSAGQGPSAAETAPEGRVAGSTAAGTRGGPAEVTAAPGSPGATILCGLAGLVTPLQVPASVPPPDSAHLARTAGSVFGSGSDVAPQLLTGLAPRLGPSLYRAWAQTTLPAPGGLLTDVTVQRAKAGVFGATAPRPPAQDASGAVAGPQDWPLSGSADPPDPRVIDLDAQYDQVTVGGWAVIERADTGKVITARVLAVQTITRSDYNLSGKVTRLTLDQPWLTGADVSLSVARYTTVYVQSEPVAPARVADPTFVGGGSIDLDGLYGGLQTGRWLIVTGERSDLPGVTTGEVVMVAGITQGAGLPGDTVHTTVRLSTALAYPYVRATVTIWGNVVAATQGATQHDVLGSGSASQAGQSFRLSRSPLTYLPAPAGAASTLDTAVDGVSWQEISNLVSAGPADHGYMTRSDDTAKTTVLFGDGVHGGRLSTGAANITATYRVGLGAAGNAQAGQISQPQTRPQGVQGVTNPLPASGGADPDSADQARGNAPLAVMALDRVVSVEDCQDFARALAGIGKASSALLSDGSQQFVHLTIGGTTAQPIERSSALYASLTAGLAANGDPHLPVRVAPCQVSFIVLTAKIHIGSRYQWSGVSAAVRAALLPAYSYQNRSLGQDVVLSDIVAAIQAVPGVDYAVVSGLAVAALSDPESTAQAQAVGFDPESTVQALAGLADTLSAPLPARITVPLATVDPKALQGVRPAQVAILSPDIADSLVLTQITP